jgi:hypothetical protein
LSRLNLGSASTEISRPTAFERELLGSSKFLPIYCCRAVGFNSRTLSILLKPIVLFLKT